MKRIVLVYCLLLFAANMAIADSKEYVGNLGVIVVTPTKSQNSIKDLATNVTVITEDKIHSSGAGTAAEVLDSVVGVTEVSLRGTRGASRDIRIRAGGDSSKQVLVLIDGNPINDASLGTADLEEISVDYIERIEVVRGPVSAVWGANALGGVVNIITKQPEEGTHVSNINIKEGTFNTSKYNVNLMVNRDGKYLAASATEEDSDGWRENSEYQGNDFLVKAGKEIESFGTVGVRLIYHKSDFGLPGTNTTDIEDYDDVLELVASSPDAKMGKLKRFFQLECDNRIQDTVVLKTRVSGSFSKNRYEYPAGLIDDILSTDSYETEIQGELDFGLLVGINFKQDAFKRVDNTVFPIVEDIDKMTKSHAVYAQQTLQIEALTAIMGGRYDVHSEFDTYFSPRTSVAYRIFDDLKVSANAGKAFRSPTFEDLYSPESSWPASFFGNAGDTKGNTDLDPETSVGYDFGIEHTIDKNVLVSKVTLFRSDIEDLIEWREIDESLNYDKWRPVNVGKAFSQGIEIELSSRLLKRLTQNFSYTRLESEGKDEDDADPSAKYKTLQYTIPHRINYSINYETFFGLDVGGSIKWADVVKWDDDFDAKHRLERHTVVNGRVSQKVSDMEVFFGVDNIFDERYQTRENYPLPGITYNTGLSLIF